MTQKEIIKSYLKSRSPEWIKEGLIRGINTDFGFIGFRGDRDVRQMIKDGEVEAKFEGKYRVVKYKIPEPPKYQTIKVLGNRTQEEIKLGI